MRVRRLAWYSLLLLKCGQAVESTTDGTSKDSAEPRDTEKSCPVAITEQHALPSSHPWTQLGYTGAVLSQTPISGVVPSVHTGVFSDLLFFCVEM